MHPSVTLPLVFLLVYGLITPLYGSLYYLSYCYQLLALEELFEAVALPHFFMSSLITTSAPQLHFGILEGAKSGQ